MRIEKIHIQNYKSLVDFQLENVKPFTAFVGPNASGKSNIFEALEFITFIPNFKFKTPDFFYGSESILSYITQSNSFEFLGIKLLLQFSPYLYTSSCLGFDLEDEKKEFKSITFGSKYVSKLDPIYHFSLESISNVEYRRNYTNIILDNNLYYKYEIEQFFDNFTRIFVNKTELDRIPTPYKLASSGKNLAQIIAKIFEDENKREDFIEWLRILIPEFKDIVVKQSNIDGKFAFEVIEKSSNKPFPVKLLSDGTRNILTLMAAVYQQEQQFLCIEEPENGLHPHAIESLVEFFREKCEGEKGHHIWLNTHSPTLIRCLNIDEVITVNKIDGKTIAKQHNNSKTVIKTDEAWLTNNLGGGVSWSK